MATNLTRDEARTRAELIGVVAYRVQLDLTGGDTTFRSRSHCRHYYTECLFSHQV